MRVLRLIIQQVDLLGLALFALRISLASRIHMKPVINEDISDAEIHTERKNAHKTETPCRDKGNGSNTEHT